MSGGGTNTVQTQQGPPAQVLQNYSDVYNQAKNVAGQPNQQYSGPVVAGFSPMQQAGFDNINTAANAGQPFIDAASQYSTNAATSLDPSNFGGTVAAYQSPYTQSVVDATQAQFNNQNQIAQNQLSGSAAQQGAFGGDRQAVAQAVLSGQQQANQAPVIAGLYNTGFQNATNAAQSNAWLNNATAGQMAGLGNETQSQGLTGANSMIQAGAMQQAEQQAELNVPYQAFQGAQAYPFQTTNWLEGMATGTGSASGGVGSTTSPGPAVASQIAGLGLAGVAGYNALSQAGAFGGGASGAADVAGSAVSSGLYSHGGQIGYSDGGGVTINGQAVPDMSVTNLPAGGMGATGTEAGSGLLGGSNNLLGGGGTMMKSTGTTSTTPDQDSTFGTIMKTAGEIAASYYGGPAGGMAANYLSSQVHFNRGGGIEDHARRVAGMAPVPVRPRGFDVGGGVTPGLTASFGGNPMQIGAEQSYMGLPDEQLTEMASRYPSTSPQGVMVQKALAARRMNPGANPAQPAVTGPPAAQTGGMSGYAPGGEVDDDDDEAPDMEVPQAGPSVPGGLAAGMGPMVLEGRAGPVSGGGRPGPTLDSTITGRARQVYDGLMQRGLSPLDAIGFAASAVQESGANPGVHPGDGGAAHQLMQWRGPRWDAFTAKYGNSASLDDALDHIVNELHGPEAGAWKKIQESGRDPMSRAAAVSEFYERPGDKAGEMRRRAGIANSLADRFTQGAARGGRIGGFADGGTPGDMSASPAPGDDDFYRPLLSRIWNGDWRGPAQQASDRRAAQAMPDASGSVFPRGLSAPSSDTYEGPPDGRYPVPDRSSAASADEDPAQPTLQSDASQPGTYGGFGGARAQPMISDGGGGTIPLPPTPPDTTLQDTQTPARSGGFGAMPKDPNDREPMKASGWESLLAAGLGMMAGTSPHAMVNIGAGGLAGLKNYQSQRQQAFADQARVDLMKTNAAWRAGQLANTQTRNLYYGQGIDNRNTTANRALDVKTDLGNQTDATRNRGIDVRQELGDQTDATRNRVADQTDATRNRLGDQTNATRQDALKQAHNDHERTLINSASNAEMARATSLVSSSRDVMGKPTMTYGQALATVQTNKPAAAPSSGGVDTTKMPSAVGPGGKVIFHNGANWINADGSPYAP